jgi:hypothetical protein
VRKEPECRTVVEIQRFFLGSRLDKWQNRRYTNGTLLNKEREMKALAQFVKQRNQFNSVFGIRALDLTVAADRQRIAEIIDSALSPENLTCDGELSTSQVRARYRELTAVARELQQLDPKVKFYEFA